MGVSKIEWTNRTWNPVCGCSRVSEGCRNCYAERQAHGVYKNDLSGLPAGLYDRKGSDWIEWPAHLRVRDWPEGMLART